MNRRRIVLVGLLVLACALAGPVWRGVNARAERRPIEVRFAHVTIHPGIIRAYDEAIAEYEKRHPDVRVVQVPVPLRFWTAFLTTQLVGGTAPDIVDVERNTPDHLVARYFIPLDDAVRVANPYNAGTDLEETPWRETFPGALTQHPTYRPVLGRVYGIPLTLGTIRAIYNRRLLDRVGWTGEPPANLADYLRLARRVEEHAKRTGVPLFLLAGSDTHALELIHQLFSSQTQRLVQRSEADALRSGLPAAEQIALSLLEGRLGFTDPACVSGFRLARIASTHTQPGFMQLARDEGIRVFAQERAVAIVTGSWEADTVFRSAEFPLVVGPVPLPATDDPVWGRFTLGAFSDAALAPGNAFGVVRGSRHPEVAIDFLRYLTSRPVSERVMDRSNRISATIGAAIGSGMKGFAPRADGYPGGFRADFPSLGRREAYRIFQTMAYQLFSDEVTVETFARGFDAAVRNGLRSDIEGVLRDVRVGARGHDVNTVAAWLRGEEPSPMELEGEWERLFTQRRMRRALATDAAEIPARRVRPSTSP